MKTCLFAIDKHIVMKYDKTPETLRTTKNNLKFEIMSQITNRDIILRSMQPHSQGAILCARTRKQERLISNYLTALLLHIQGKKLKKNEKKQKSYIKIPTYSKTSKYHNVLIKYHNCTTQYNFYVLKLK